MRQQTGYRRLPSVSAKTKAKPAPKTCRWTVNFEGWIQLLTSFWKISWQIIRKKEKGEPAQINKHSAACMATSSPSLSLSFFFSLSLSLLLYSIKLPLSSLWSSHEKTVIQKKASSCVRACVCHAAMRSEHTRTRMCEWTHGHAAWLIDSK